MTPSVMAIPPPVPTQETPFTQGLPPGQMWVRAGFWTRLSVVFIDISIAMVCLMPFNITQQSNMMLIFIFLYFFVCDLFISRSVGKWLLGLHYRNKDGSPVDRGKLMARSFLRIFGPFGILSWRKTTLVDLMSGSRVFQIQHPKRKKKGPGPANRRTFEPIR